MSDFLETVREHPCSCCGEPTVHADHLCNSCWVILKTLPSFLRLPGGMSTVLEMIDLVKGESGIAAPIADLLVVGPGNPA